MPSGNTGKVIASLLSKKKGVEITFEDGETLWLPAAIYAEGFYYTGKRMEAHDLTQLKNNLELHPFTEYALHLLQRGRYSEYQVREKLYHRKALKFQVDQVIETLKKHHLLDDAQLMKDLVMMYQERNYGLNWIKEKLYTKGFSSSLIDTIAEDVTVSVHAMDKLLPRLIKQYQTLAYRDRVEKIKERMRTRGFSNQAIAIILKKIPEADITQELTNLKFAMRKAYERYRKRYQDRTLQDKVTNFLLTKGYKYANIKALLKEYFHVN